MSDFSLGLGILSWKARLSLEKALISYKNANLFDLFDKKLIFFQEFEEADGLLAKSFSLPYKSSSKNLGIFQGFKTLAQEIPCSILVLLENDCPLEASSEELVRQIHYGAQLLKDPSCAVVRLRHRRNPGQKFTCVDKYRRYYPPAHATKTHQLLAQVRRLLRPLKTQRIQGISFYAQENFAHCFPEIFRPLGEDFFAVSPFYMPWTNQSIMIRRDFFLDVLLNHVENTPSRRLIQGEKTIEIELNSSWWRGQSFWIGLGPGLFTHQRID